MGAAVGRPGATYLELQGTRGPGSATTSAALLLAALAPYIGLADEVDPRDLETARRLGFAVSLAPCREPESPTMSART